MLIESWFGAATINYIARMLSIFLLAGKLHEAVNASLIRLSSNIRLHSTSHASISRASIDHQPKRRAPTSSPSATGISSIPSNVSWGSTHPIKAFFKLKPCIVQHKPTSKRRLRYPFFHYTHFATEPYNKRLKTTCFLKYQSMFSSKRFTKPLKIYSSRQILCLL